jgi:hypothetical protein
MSMLDHLHTLRTCENFELGLENEINDHDQNYYYSLFLAVCGNERRNPDERLDATINEVYSQVFPAEDALDSANMGAFMAEIANDSVQNFNEHISRNIQPIFCRLLCLNMSLDPNFEDGPQVIKKLALHVYKLLSNQATVWPFSVPVTDERIAKCQALIEQYFNWFQFLTQDEENGDEIDLDYDPDRDRAQEEEDDDDDDIDMVINEDNDYEVIIPDDRDVENEEEVI